MQATKPKYSQEFRAEAIKLVLEKNQTQSQVSRNLKISNQTLSNWITIARRSDPTHGSTDSASAAAFEAENKRLRKALAVAEMERDILKYKHCLDATAFFAKDTLRGTHS